jgi:small subunit ribosomal protein S17
MAETENNEPETPDAAQAPAVQDAPEAAAPQAPPEPPKERRRRARASKAAQAKARQPRTPEERHAERVETRRAKAQERRVGRARAREKARARAGGAEVQSTPPREHGPGRQKTRQGVVVSDKADKTITVRIDIAKRHRRYQKIVRSSMTLHAHDEANDANEGDTVRVVEARPMSATKRWRLVEILERAK